MPENKTQPVNNQPAQGKKVLLKDWGNESARKVNGSQHVLSNCLDIIYTGLLEETGSDEKALKRHKEALEQEITQNENNIVTKKQHIKHIEGEKIPAKRLAIEALKEQVKSLKLQGIKEPVDFKTVAIAGAIVLGLTVYLFLFYSSVMYTVVYGQQDLAAALKQNQVIFVAIFNTEALQRAAWMGASSLIIVCAFPFVFIGMGFLLHKYLKNRSYLRVAMFLLATLLFDAVLAYLIAKNIYEVRYLARLEEHMWEGGMAFNDINFYFVILAGFVVYIIWGFLLDTLLGEFDKGSKTRAHQVMGEQLRQLNQDIKEEKDALQALKEQNGHLKSEVTDLQGAIRNCQKQIEQLERGIVSVDLNLLEKRIKEFMEGWKEFLFSYYAQQRADQMSHEANQLARHWLQAKTANAAQIQRDRRK